MTALRASSPVTAVASVELIVPGTTDGATAATPGAAATAATPGVAAVAAVAVAAPTVL